MKLYTRSGDAGTTALWAGARTNKESDRIESIGLVDALDGAFAPDRGHGGD